jgi:hypothetical protein
LSEELARLISNFIRRIEKYLIRGAIVVLKNSASNLNLTYHPKNQMNVFGDPDSLGERLLVPIE